MASDSAATIVRARKTHYCFAQIGYPYPCRRVIPAGTLYVRSVAFPNHDANGSGKVLVRAVCDNCAAAYPDQLPQIPAPEPIHSRPETEPK